MQTIVVVWLVAAATATRAADPDVPSNVSPLSGSVQVPARTNLCAQVTDPDLDTLTVRFLGRELTAAPDEDFTVFTIPDSQFYTQRHPEMYYAQTDWIVANRESTNAAFVAHVGDIVHLAAGGFEWSVASAAMARLENPATTQLVDGIPYGMAVGNHDQFPNNNAGNIANPGVTTEAFNATFGLSRFEGRSYWGGHYGDNADNTYQFFSAGGMDFIVVHLEFDGDLPVSPLRDDVLAWADALLKTHADRRAIVVSHHLLCVSQSCPPTIEAPLSLQGQATYAALKNNPNLFLFLAGHAGDANYQNRRVDSYQGREVHTLMSCYHFGDACPYLCGKGFMRVMRFSPANDEIDVKTYSPYLDQYKTNEYSQFVIPYDMNGGRQFREVGTVTGVSSGATACVPWTDLQNGARYEWYAEVSDGGATAAGPRWTFDDNGTCFVPPACADGDPCTIDTCPGRDCTHTPIPLCCIADADCDDGNWCTDDQCVAGSCVVSDNTRACDDGDPCSDDDTCSQGACDGTPRVCDDGNACSDDYCLGGACTADYLPLPGCCVQHGDCYDENPCTDDSCTGATCVNTTDPNCCLTDAQCADADGCTLDACLPRNRGALILDSPYDHVTMLRPGYTGGEDVPGHYPGLNASEFTVELWFQWDGSGIITATSGYEYGYDPGGIEAYPLVSKGIRGAEFVPSNPSWNGLFSVNYFLGILEPGGVLTADLESHPDAVPAGSTHVPNHPVTGTTVITPGAWHHAAATYDGNCWQLYLDGLPETDGTNCPRVRPADQTLHFFSIGAGQGWEGLLMGSFFGKVDEVRVWSRALTEAEIQSQMQTQIAAHPDLLGRWSLDELGLAPDTTGNENTGVVVGAALETVDLVDFGGSACVNRTPVEVGGVQMLPGTPCDYYFCPGPPTFTKVRWNESSLAVLPYDVVSGLLSDLRSGGGTISGECLTNDTSGPFFDDLRAPPPAGEGFFYLIREQGLCSGGTYGTDSASNPRLPDDICP